MGPQKAAVALRKKVFLIKYVPEVLKVGCIARNSLLYNIRLQHKATLDGMAGTEYSQIN